MVNEMALALAVANRALEQLASVAASLQSARAPPVSERSNAATSERLKSGHAR
jgi:hypothetical protein